jgi:uncharacterized protein (DUF1684 family)
VLLVLVTQRSASYEQHLVEWRKSRIVEAAGPEGWTTVVALHWLQPGITRVGSRQDVEARLPASAPPLIGTLRVDGKAASFETASGVDVTSNGARVSTTAMTPDETTLQVGTYTLLVIARAGRLALRVRDRESAARAGFKGIDCFPVSAESRVEARFVPFHPPKTATVVNVIGDPVEFQSPGQVVFARKGVEYRLDALYETPEKKDLWIIFRDRTSGVTTYPAGRYLHVPLPANGKVDLDFNLAYNPPCAFTEFATCPIPPRQNWLKIPIEAGEKDYHAEKPKPQASRSISLASSLGGPKPAA